MEQPVSIKITNTLPTCFRAECRNFAKGEGLANLGCLKKKEGAQLQTASWGALEDNVVPHST